MPGASDRLPPADYDHIFKEDESDEPSKAPVAVGRFKAFVHGFMFFIIPLILAAFGVGKEARDIYRHYTFAHVDATVTAVVLPGPRGQVTVISCGVW